MPARKGSPKKKQTKFPPRKIGPRKKKIIEDNIPDPGDGVPVMLPQEAVNHPSHYGGQDNPYEAIKIIEAIPHIKNDFHKGNGAKYLLRAGLKVGIGKTKVEQEIEDLQKCMWYVERKISLLQAELEK